MSNRVCTRCKSARAVAGKYTCAKCNVEIQTESRARVKRAIEIIEAATEQPVTLTRRTIMRQLPRVGTVIIRQYYENGELVAESQPEKVQANG